ncbi:ParB/RepB/Spo0J family partition protein [Candidatus Saccharibacteria bacterium]|nr:ParB/RepB/Spo0J family partition protein [Candidatus Saccharibacteria bacterium]
MAKNRLGQGLSALIKTDIEQFDTQEVMELDLGRIKVNPDQPRRKFDQDKLEELALSIKQHGIIQPLIVQDTGESYQLIAGERRLQAAKIAGLGQVPVVVRKVEDEERLELAIVENLQRSNLTAIEYAKAVQRLIDKYHLNYQQIAERLGKAKSTVVNMVRLLRLPEEIQDAVQSGHISEGHARAILSLDSTKDQLYILAEILHKKLSVRDVEKLVKTKSSKSEQKSSKNFISQIKLSTDRVKSLSSKTGLAIQVKATAAKRGRVVINYESQEDLDRILDSLDGAQDED